ncbi:hypothetical protein CC79DRAFT_484391 [Sarocladium strictum]
MRSLSSPGSESCSILHVSLLRRRNSLEVRPSTIVELFGSLIGLLRSRHGSSTNFMRYNAHLRYKSPSLMQCQAAARRNEPLGRHKSALVQG